MHSECAWEILDLIEANPTWGVRRGDEVIRYCTDVVARANKNEAAGLDPDTGEPVEPLTVTHEDDAVADGAVDPDDEPSIYRDSSPSLAE